MKDDNRTSAEIARDAERQRDGLARTLDELSRRMTPGEIVDDVWKMARRGQGGELVQNFGRDVREHPLPLALIGAGIAWLMLPKPRRNSAIRDMEEEDSVSSSSVYRGRTYDYGSPQGDYEGSSKAVADEGYAHYAPPDDAYDEHKFEFENTGNGHSSTITGRARDAVSSTTGAISAASAQARDAISRTSAATRHAVEDASSQIGGAMSATHRQAGRMRKRTRHQARNFGRGIQDTGERTSAAVRDFISQQPIAAAAIGFACGAAIASLFRTTETEDRLVGDVSDRMKRQARNRAEEGYEAVLDVTRQTVEDVADEAEKQGLTPESLRNTANDLRERAEAVIDRGMHSISDAAETNAKAINGETEEVRPSGNNREPV